jgi:hypothetical protein
VRFCNGSDRAGGSIYVQIVWLQTVYVVWTVVVDYVANDVCACMVMTSCVEICFNYYLPFYPNDVIYQLRDVMGGSFSRQCSHGLHSICGVDACIKVQNHAYCSPMLNSLRDERESRLDICIRVQFASACTMRVQQLISWSCLIAVSWCSLFWRL